MEGGEGRGGAKCAVLVGLLAHDRCVVAMPSLPQSTTANSSWLLANICSQEGGRSSLNTGDVTGAQVCYTSSSGGCIHHWCQVVLPPGEWVETPLLPGGWVETPLPPTQHEEYLLLDDLVHHFQRGLQVAVAMATGLCHTGTDVHTEHVEVLQQTRRVRGRAGATHHAVRSLHTVR